MTDLVEPRIADHGAIGDLDTAALVARSGTIDWLCFPWFDSAPIFDRLLDAEEGGGFEVRCELDGARRSQVYLPDTNVLLTRFLAEEGHVEITDFMSVDPAQAVHALVRRVEVIRGELDVHLSCRPRFDYGRTRHSLSRREEGAVFLADDGRPPALRLYLSRPWEARAGGVEATCRLRAGQYVDAVLTTLDDDTVDPRVEGFVEEALARTVRFWRTWIARSQYQGRWRPAVSRSSLALKLLTSRRAGAMVAAPTFGLPEVIGGPRNWDYRYAWIRDASLAIREFLALGHTDEAAAFVRWLLVECLARAGELDRARVIFEKMLGAANEVGLYAEELGPTGEQLGNFPQALSHLGVITAARCLDRELDRGGAFPRRVRDPER